MSKIIGVTVGTSTPRPDFEQKNPKKADFIKNNPLPDITEADEGKVLCVAGDKFVLTDAPNTEEAAKYKTRLYRHNISFIGESVLDDGGNYIVGGKKYIASFVDENPEPCADGVDIYDFDFSVLNGALIVEYDYTTGEKLGTYTGFAGYIDYDQFGLYCLDGSISNIKFAGWDTVGNPTVTDTVECISGELVLNQPLTFTGAVEATYDGKEPLTVNIPSGSGGGDTWELIAKGKVTEDVTDILITEDMNGEPLQLKRVAAYGLFYRHTSNGGVGFNISNESAKTLSSSAHTYVDNKSMVYLEVWVTPYGTLESVSSVLANATLYSSTLFGSGLSKGILHFSNHLSDLLFAKSTKPINRISVSGNLKAGSSYEIYGVRA